MLLYNMLWTAGTIQARLTAVCLFMLSWIHSSSEKCMASPLLFSWNLFKFSHLVPLLHPLTVCGGESQGTAVDHRCSLLPPPAQATTLNTEAAMSKQVPELDLCTTNPKNIERQGSAWSGTSCETERDWSHTAIEEIQLVVALRPHKRWNSVFQKCWRFHAKELPSLFFEHVITIAREATSAFYS